MSTSSIASTVVFFILTLAGTLLIFRYYTRVSAKSMPLLCCVFIMTAVYSSILPFPLLVVDISSALYAKTDPKLKETWLVGLWYGIVTVTYIMGWLVLPVSQLYTEVGEFTPKRRIIRSIKTNAKLYAISVVILFVLFLYIVFLKGAYGSTASILRLAISLANAWGLILLLLFMSTGLVGIPRMLWRHSDVVRLLRYSYFSAVNIQEDLDIAAIDLTEVKSELMAIHPLVSEEHKPYWSQMMEAIADADRDIPQYHSASARARPPTRDNHIDVSLNHLEELNKRVKRSIKIAQRMNYLWDSTIRNCQIYDKMLCEAQCAESFVKRMWLPMRGIFFKGASLCATVLTLLVLWSELVLPFQSLFSEQLSVISLVMNSRFELIGSMVFMFYMAYCSYWAILQLKVFDIYVILPSISDNASLCFGATFLARLIMPLCFNFLLISDLVTDDVDVMYGHVYRRNMDVTLVLGSWFNHFLPVFIPFVSLLVLAKISDRLLLLIEVEVHNPDDMMNTTVCQRVEDGHRLVAHALGQPLTALGLGISSDNSVLGMKLSSGNDNGAQPLERGERYREYLAKKNAANGTEAV